MSSSPRAWVAPVVAFAFVILRASVAGATPKEIGPADDLSAALITLAAGDEIVLRGGTYTLAAQLLVTAVGTAAAPIVVRAKAGERPHLHRPLANQNVVDFVKVSYFTLRGIEFTGGSRGLRLMDASDTTIEDCEVHDTGDVAIAATDEGRDYARLAILRNHVHHTNASGEGMYLGCNNDGCRIHDSIIAGNHVHHTNGPSVVQGDGIEIKEGGYANVVRDNVIHDTNFPGIITYSTKGRGAPNVIERNLVWASNDNAIQCAADVVIRNNVLLGAAGAGIRNQPHQSGTPSNIQIVHNTIIAPTAAAIYTTGITGSVLIANNALYAPNAAAISVSGALGAVTVTKNVGVGTLIGAPSGLTAGDLALDFVAANTSGKIPNDVFPKIGSSLIGAGDSTYLVADDFNGAARGATADVGAYKFAPGGNPGWPFAESFKPAFASVDGGAGDGGTPPRADDGGANGEGGWSEAGTGFPPDDRDLNSGCGCHAVTRANDETSSLAAACALSALGAAVAIRRRRRS